MSDIFDQTILCRKCGKKMLKTFIVRNGFKMRILECKKCRNKIVHPSDLNNYRKFSRLKKKNFQVKLRIVGNSYAISIPKEIVDFIKEQEKIHNNIVNLFFEKAGKLSLTFGEIVNKTIEKQKRFIKENFPNLNKKK